jgi:hypothetical protein
MFAAPAHTANNWEQRAAGALSGCRRHTRTNAFGATLEYLTALEALMIGWLTSAFVVGAAMAATAVPALAITCYEVIDRNDVVILRDTHPPVDLSIAGAPSREAMRGRGELLVISDVETCVVVGRVAPGGNKTLTTDEIVAGWRPTPLQEKSSWGTYSSRYGGLLTPAPIPTPMQAP